MSFVHLHVHSEYSLLDGLSKVDKLVERAKSMDMPAVALTDHGAMFGSISFYRAAKKAGIKPIIGIESYMAARGMTDRDPQFDSRSFHLLLLAENDTGYRNLLEIASASQLEGFYYRPRIDHEFLAAHSEGLICTTGCLSGEVPRALQAGQEKKAVELLDWYYEVFGPDRFFFELQQHDIPELENINKQLVDLAKRYDGRFVATNDVHYVDPDDAELQDILLCIQTGSLQADPDRMMMTDSSYYMRSPQEMQQLFGHIPGALENTLWIAERCDVDLEFKGYHLPQFEVPDGHTPETYLRMLCEQGLRERYGRYTDDEVVRERLDYELKIIHEMGFDTYFLIVWDLCRYAQEHNIWYNARGSAAGSIVAYSLEITTVDPIKHGLIFERFLNPGRVSMPDIDLDFQDDRRSELLEYTADKYGRDKVAQIITFGTLGARAAIRDVGRVKDIPLPEVDRVAKLVPNIPGKPVSISDALEDVPRFRELYEQTSYLRDLIDTANQLEGVVRNAGTHAAGVIITDKPIVEYIPLHRPTGSSQDDNPIGAVTQFEMHILDSLGLLKVDFLGLSTLTVMARACEMIAERHGVELDINSIPIDDADTFELLGRGDVLGVFQVEGVGMRRYLMEMKPRELANVIAMVALYRPGPMDFIPTYIRRMHGLEQPSYRHPTLAGIFEETYGIPVYQEQIMFAAMEMAGYSASEADGLRKAISKKNASALAKHKQKFIQGAVGNQIEKATAEAVFEDWENFARYGFNKAHAADYGVIA
ncbi:MAG: DNA polymerase III subunit alpha, partial [Anaerolineales bacterium]